MQPGIQKKLYDFIDILRDAGVTVSTDEILALFDAVPMIPFDDRVVFRQSLKTTLVKDFTDIPVFDTCFSEFFEGQASDIDISSLQEDTSQRFTREEADALEDMVRSFMESLSEDLIMEKEADELLSIFLEEIEAAGSSGGTGINLFQQRSDPVLSRYSGQGGEAGDDEERDRVNTLLLTLIKRNLPRKRIGKKINDREDYLLNKYIYQLTPEEIREMREIVRRFGQKLKNRISQRKKRVKHGSFDIKRTIRNSLQYGGVPFKISHRDKKIERPQIVVLCDVSGSVNQYTRFMLLITHTLQSLFSKVRTFAFISNMVEITPLFMEMDPERAINSIFHDTDFTYGWGSNYGRCFDMFVSDYSDSLTKKTTVMILGDARNNNQDPGLHSFIRMKERSKNIFWLNPDKKHLWDWGDSIASIYLPHCTDMKEVNSIIDLSQFIDKLFTDLALNR